MKTTIDIADGLLKEAKRIAARENTTVRELVELGLRHVVQQRARRQPFQLKKASFRGDGLQDRIRDLGWEGVLAAIYEGRGGL
jgi:Arc/MetJ family transcription regulator